MNLAEQALLAPPAFPTRSTTLFTENSNVPLLLQEIFAANSVSDSIAMSCTTHVSGIAKLAADRGWQGSLSVPDRVTVLSTVFCAGQFSRTVGLTKS